MSFITLDSKNWCKGIYHNGTLFFEEFPKNLSRTWKYCSYLSDLDIEYAYLYAEGKTVDEVCPDNLKDRWTANKNKLSAFHNSFLEAKVSLEENCFYDLVPQQFLLELCETKSKIIDFVIFNYKKPENYDFLLKVQKLLTGISQNSLNIDLSQLKTEMHDQRARNLYNKISKQKHEISYDLFGSKTGRLTTKKNTFPILNLDSKYRSIIKPKNDLFVELDFNAAEARTLLTLAGKKQPEEDIHSYNAKKFSMTREEAKVDFFSWLYGSKKIDSKKYEDFFDLNKIMSSFYDGSIIKNFYNRKIKTDQFHSLNYLIQSTTNDLVLNQILKIEKILKTKKSCISFIVHDSVVLDIAKEDKELIKVIIDLFSQTDLGTFPVNVSVGKDYGSLRKL